MTLYDTIKTEAENLGFCLFGVTNPEPISSFPIFVDWITRNQHAGMAYLASDYSFFNRKNPASLLPGCRSIIMVGMPYSPPRPSLTCSDELHGMIASYACGMDYHAVIPPRLEQLVNILEKITNKTIQRKVFCDSSPILEKALAHRSGLGWIGKNGCLINPYTGSYFFLGGVLLDIPIESPSFEHPDRCGKCTRCIDACPTHCIESNRTIDANLCVSYLTIENKSVIPREIRRSIQNHIFGCDICQQVCPWNQNKKNNAVNPDFIKGKGMANPLLTEEILLDSSSFKQKFYGTPVLRAKRKGYLRNVAVALGNSSSELGVEPLSITLFNEKEALVRAHAAWALGEIRTSIAHLNLEKALKSEAVPEVVEEIKTAISGG